MRIPNLIAAALLGVAAISPAFADQDALAQFDPQTLVNGVISEQDVSLFFDYLRASMFAASQGLPAPQMPEALQRRAQAIGDELKARGALAALSLVNALEARARREFRGPVVPPRPALPPTTPYSTIRD